MDQLNQPRGLFTVRSKGQQSAHQRLTFPVPLTDITDRILFVSCFLPPKEADFSFVARFGFLVVLEHADEQAQREAPLVLTRGPFAQGVHYGYQGLRTEAILQR